MAKRYGGRRAFNSWKPRRRDPVDWDRPGPTSLAGLTGGNAQDQFLLRDATLLRPSNSAILDFGGKGEVRLVRLICKICLAVATNLVPALIEYFYGIRIVELSAGAISTVSEPSVFMATAESRSEDWLWWDNTTQFVPVTGTGVTPITVSPGGAPYITLDFKPGRSMRANFGLTFIHGWRFAGGGTPDATVVGDIVPQMLWANVRR